MAIHAILFDIDNTLLDWSAREVSWFKDPRGHGAHLTTLVQALVPDATPAQVNAVRDCFDDLQTRIVQDDLDEAPHLGRMLADSLRVSGLLADPPPIAELVQLYDWITTPQVRPFAEVPDALATLTARGYRLGIITNGYQPIAQRERELAAYGLLSFFPECRFSSADVGFLKPDKRIFERALGCLGLPAAQVVYVGDHIFMDVLGAQQAGLKGVWRPPNHLDVASFGWIKPDGIIDTLHDLLPLLDEWP
ncbi:MAG: HAD family hydrolase [Anaerolineales bacterium]